jgi:hypothetical protein
MEPSVTPHPNTQILFASNIFQYAECLTKFMEENSPNTKRMCVSNSIIPSGNK